MNKQTLIQAMLLTDAWDRMHPTRHDGVMSEVEKMLPFAEMIEAGTMPKESFDIYQLTKDVLSTDAHHILSGLNREINRQEMIRNNKKLYSHIVPKVSDKFEVGSILYTSWGYDQTNVGFYVIVAMNGKTQCTVLELVKNYEATGWMCGNASAGKDIYFKEEPKRRKINARFQSISITDCASAWLWDGKNKMTSSYA